MDAMSSPISSMPPGSAVTRAARWLVIPLGLGLMALVAMAISGESREDFEEAQNQQAQQEERSAPRQPQDTDADDGEGEAEQFQPDSEFEAWQTTDETTSNRDVVFDDGGDQVEVNLTPNGTITADPVEPGEGDSDEPEDSGRYSGVRITGDGFLDMVDLGDEVSGDFIVTPNAGGNGLIFEQVDGPTVEVLLTDENVELRRADGTRTAALTGETVTISAGFGIPAHPDAARESFVTSLGSLDVWLAEDGSLVGSRPDADATVRPNDGLAIRIDEGEPAAVPIESIENGDVALRPADTGFDRQGRDGQVVQFRPDGYDGGMTASEVQNDGGLIELEPDANGSVALTDGTTVQPISVTEPPEIWQIKQGSIPWRLFFGAVGLIALGSIALALFLHVDFRKEPLPTTLVDETPPDRLNALLAELHADPDPTRAVRRAFHIAEVGFGGLPSRRPTETPFEWSRRVERSNTLLAQPVSAMCDLFVKARFAPYQASEQDRTAMIEALGEAHRKATGGFRTEAQSEELVGT